MGGGPSTTTAREESEHGGVSMGPVLDWVWPRCRRMSLASPRLDIGRDDGASIQLLGSGVSRRHASLERDGHLYILRDLGSTNGTWVNGSKAECVHVAPGAVVRIGDWVGVFGECSIEEMDDVGFSEVAPGVFGGAELAAIVRTLRRAALSRAPILLVGDTGTGKEGLARAVHHFSGRSGAFLAVNCAALPEQMAEAELFGYRRGAFTGAERGSTGHFRAAHEGTLFLDEMPELSPSLQAKLLRAADTGEVLALGESKATLVDSRIVCASQQSLRELVEQHRLRRDLAARLGGLTLQLPPLRRRRADIAPLFNHFLEAQSGGHHPAVDARLVEALCLYDWPENVRELKSVAEALLSLHGHEAQLRRRHLPPEIACDGDEPPRVASSAPPQPQLDLERLKQELQGNQGNVRAAAEALGVSRQRIYRLLGPDLKGYRDGN